MASLFRKSLRQSRGSKSSSTGTGGLGRRVKISMSTMNKQKKSSHKPYRGQGR